MVTHALSARLPVFLGTKVPERNLQILLYAYMLKVYTPFTTHASLNTCVHIETLQSSRAAFSHRR